MKMHKLCPRCGSKNVDWIIPQNWSQCVCRDCDYTGPIVDSYPMVSILFAKNKEMGVHSLSLTILGLINNDQIRCDIDLDESYEVGKKLTPKDMEVMKKITLRIANKGELKTSESLAIKLLKNMNKNKKFNCKTKQ